MNVLSDMQDHCVLTNISTSYPNTKQVNSCKEGLLQDLTPFPSGLGKLTLQTLQNLQTFFHDQTSHQPSQAM